MRAVYVLGLLAAFAAGAAVGARLVWGLATDVINLERKQAGPSTAGDPS